MFAGFHKIWNEGIFTTKANLCTLRNFLSTPVKDFPIGNSIFLTLLKSYKPNIWSVRKGMKFTTFNVQLYFLVNVDLKLRVFGQQVPDGPKHNVERLS